MDKVNIICVDDQREVLDAIIKDLSVLASAFHIEDCESADEALDLIDELDAEGEHVALIISDHVMPEKTGVELLTEISLDPRFRLTRKVLITGQATHADTIEAINNAAIEKYFEKPWNADALSDAAKRLVTHYVFDAGLDYREYQAELDTQVVFDRLK